MSINKNRAKMKNCTDNKTYNIMYMKTYIDPWHEGYNENRHGQMHHQLRSYKTWKYNRKKQYKE